MQVFLTFSPIKGCNKNKRVVSKRSVNKNLEYILEIKYIKFYYFDVNDQNVKFFLRILKILSKKCLKNNVWHRFSLFLAFSDEQFKKIELFNE